MTVASSVARFGTAIANMAVRHECNAVPVTIIRRLPAAMKLLKMFTAVPRMEECAVSLT